MKEVITRGMRNNNPANIRKGSRWKGLKRVLTDPNFCEFTDLEYGIRAFLILCRTYRKAYRICYVPEFINRFAPNSENDTSAYIQYVMENYPFNDGLFTCDTDYVYFAKIIFKYESRMDIKLSVIRDVMKKYNIKIVK